MIYPHRKRSGGFTLTHMLCALTLLTAFAVISTRLLESVIRVYRTTDITQARANRYESAIYLLRKDVWSARKIDVVNPRQVELTEADGKITWQFDDEGAIVRTTDPARSTRWQDAGKDLSFTFDSTGLLIQERNEDPALATRLINGSGSKP